MLELIMIAMSAFSFWSYLDYSWYPKQNKFLIVAVASFCSACLFGITFVFTSTPRAEYASAFLGTISGITSIYTYCRIRYNYNVHIRRIKFAGASYESTGCSCWVMIKTNHKYHQEIVFQYFKEYNLAIRCRDRINEIDPRFEARVQVINIASALENINQTYDSTKPDGWKSKNIRQLICDEALLKFVLERL